MKKLICLFLSLLFIILLCGCGSQDTESINFGQEVTIVKMPSPSKCKTTNDITTVDRVIDVLGQIDKEPIDGDNINGGWSIMIKITIDGQNFNYTIGNVFTDFDGKQYEVTNLNYIEEKITDIYNDIDAPEVDYQ